jgi:SpoVK/Ycf46/Vps4 family AAA+-type ATPase
MPIDFVKSTRYIETGTSEKIKRHMHAFLNNLSVYKKYNQPPKRSILLHGDPGTGKTACIRNFINENFVGQERVCVLYIDSQGVSWETITQMFMESDVSTVDLVFFVVEDIGGTELEERGNSISSTLLNFLDGNRSVFRVPTLLVSTTNFLGRLGKALKRPGRFDVLLAVDAPGFEEFCVLVEGVLDRSLTEDERDAFKGSGFTPAFGIEAVIRAEIMGESIAQVVRQLKEQRTTAEGAAEGVMGFGGDDDDDL